MLIGKNALYHYVDGARKLACNVKCALCGDMSEQYISLDPTARSRYLAKLQVLGLTEVEDPLARGMIVSSSVFEYPTCKQHQLYPESHSESQPSIP